MLVNRSLGFSRRGFSGLQIIPPLLINPARAALIAQGVDPKMISDSGELDPQALVAIAFNKVEISTTATPTITIDLSKTGEGQASAAVRALRPTVVLSGRAGRVVIAPAGETAGNPAALQAGLGVGLGLVGLLIAKAFLL